MGKMQPGRFTARPDGDVVVFIIGMRFNKRWKVWRWWQVFTAMPRMLRTLAQQPELGLLHVETMVTTRQIVSVQYWRSYEQLERFARTPDPHFDAWRRFNREIGASGDVGIFHETYPVRAGEHESIYVNMPVIGLAAAGRSVAAAGQASARRETASALSER